MNAAKVKSSKINLKVEEKLISNPKEVAETFNHYFISLANKLSNQLPERPGIYNEIQVKSFYGQRGVIQDSLKLRPVSEREVLKCLNKLKINKASGLDNIPARFFRDSARVIAPYVTYILNLSIEQGKVPREFKSARLMPVYKKGCKLNMVNYRPVSVLGAMSKILERVIYDQIEEYISKNNILYDLQSGFRPLHSTETCILYMTDKMRKEVDNGKFCGMVMLDLQKAFDTVDHNILLYKLKAVGFDKNSLRWVKSYLDDRCQRVDIKGILSSPLFINCGVPQGSILGPLFFLLYINDLKAACSEELILYADDAVVLVFHQDKGVLEETMTLQLQVMSKWFLDNRLSLHAGKTETILFASKMKLRKDDTLSIKINDMAIEVKKVVNYLGCLIDNKLTGDFMARKVFSKICGKIRFLARQAEFLDVHSLTLLAGALIQPHFDYATSFWYSSCSQVMKNKLQKAQNKLVRVILKVHSRSSLHSDSFKELGLLTVEKRMLF